MQNSTEKEFYNIYYEKIKNTESCLLSQISNKLQVLNNQSETKMIEHMTSRIKTTDSATRKLRLAGYEPTAKNAVSILSDVIGIRLIAHFIGDIYTIRNILVNCGEFDIVKEKDYIRNAKPTGYRGYHIILNTNIDGFPIRAEIQLRTIAMDCWASLEHQIRYKKEIKNTDLIDFELKKCSDDLMSADIAMEQIWSLVRNSAEDVSDSVEFYEEAMAYTAQIHNLSMTND
jgi:putative GTP pyrophosphokinase